MTATLDTWSRFANGDSLDATRLGELVDTLGTTAGDQAQYRWLAEAIKQYSHDAAIHLPGPEPEAHGIGPPGPELGS